MKFYPFLVKHLGSSRGFVYS